MATRQRRTTEDGENKPKRTRTRNIQTPGSDAPNAPVTAPAPPQTPEEIAEATPAVPPDAPTPPIDVVAEMAKEGNVITVVSGYNPEVGAEWNGMVLTEHGWCKP